jgi:hypothetical protein
LLISGPDQPWTAALEPRYVLELARLLEKTGDRVAAGTEYRRFLDYRKGADAGLPEAAEARVALGRCIGRRAPFPPLEPPSACHRGQTWV